MPYRIEYRPQVLDDFQAIPLNMRERIRRAILSRLGSAPEVYGERLGKDLSGLWKIRVGGYRVVFELHPSEQQVTIWCIQARKHVYPEAQRRWRRR